MAILPVRQFGDHVLRQKSQPVDKINKEIKDLVKNMADTMYDAQGLGLAAVQVGILQQVIVIDISGEGTQLRAIINPKIIDKYGETIEEEGCLSIHNVRVPIKRAEAVKVKGIDLKTGEEITVEAADWLARAFQHEIDHLEGKLILDRISGDERRQILKDLSMGGLKSAGLKGD